MSDERIISADSHLLVRDEALLAHLPSAHRPTVQRFLAERQAAQARAQTGLRTHAVWPAWNRPGEWDPHERLKDMDIDGVDAEVLYASPTAGTELYALKDGARLAAFQAFNDAALDFASVAPSRLLPVYILPVADLEEAVHETRRLARAGARALMIPLFPVDVGLRPYFDRSWDPLWAAVEDCGIPISQHLGGHAHSLNVMAYDTTPNKGIFRALAPVWMAESLAAWAMSGVLERFPGLRIILIEAGLGWLPFFLDRMDRTVRQIGWGPEVLRETPSFYWRRNMAATFEEDEFGVRNRHLIGVENLMWATDYPHPDSTWPRSREVIREHFADVPRDEVRKMIAENAARLYRLA